MSSQNEIRQAYTRDCSVGCQAGESAWLIKGDFDHFKATNDLYGSLIADTILDWSLEVIEAELGAFQKRQPAEMPLLNATGDDVTIYIPPSRLAEEDIWKLLWKIRAAVEKSFWRRYLVGTLAIPADFFDGLSQHALQMMRFELEEMDVVLDLAARQRGYLLLLPLGPDGACQPALDGVIQILQRRCGKSLPRVELHLDWVANPDQAGFSTFNKGCLVPPGISFAACSTGMAGMPVYEQLTLACQSALKLCKQQRRGVYIPQQDAAGQPGAGQADGPGDLPGRLAAAAGAPSGPPSVALDNAPAAAPPPVTAPVHLRWFSERYLHEILYFKELAQPVLFQFNPVYRLPKHAPEDLLQAANYRGNTHGIGLKGINELCGQATADCIIQQLLCLFSQGLQDSLAEKGLRPDQLYTAQFVDRFTVCSERPIFQLPEIVDLVRCLAGQFNGGSNEMKIAHLRISVALGETPLLGCHLFHQLALTSLAPQPLIQINADPPVEVRQNCSAALHEGRLALERSAYLSARLLFGQ